MLPAGHPRMPFARTKQPFRFEPKHSGVKTITKLQKQ